MTDKIDVRAIFRKLRGLQVGDHIELPVHYDMWMRGARYGRVTSRHRGSPGQSAYVSVKLDALPHNARRVKVWALDWEHCRIDGEQHENVA